MSMLVLIEITPTVVAVCRAKDTRDIMFLFPSEIEAQAYVRAVEAVLQLRTVSPGALQIGPALNALRDWAVDRTEQVKGMKKGKSEETTS